MWFFFSPNIVYGEDALDFFENISGEKCFIVTDKVIEDLGFLKILTDKLEKLGKNYTVFNEVLPDPREEGVLKATDLCKEYSPDLIIALGGGSVIDTAKVVWCLYEFPDSELDDIYVFRQELYDMGKKAKMVAIPTTSGTGAETTFVSLISRFQENIWKKYYYLHKGLIPTYAIVDPIFPLKMPPKLTVDTAFDAIAHSIEGVASLWKNEFSDALALKAIELIFKYLPVAYKDGNNKEARDYLHQAATISGLAFGNSQVHIGHTLGHSFGSFFKVPHGRSVGIILNYVTQFVMNNPDSNEEEIKIYSKLAKQLGWAKWDEDDKKAANLVIEKIKGLQKEVNFPLNLKETGISKDEFENSLDTLISLCYQDSSSTLATRSPSEEEFRQIFRYAFEGEDIDF